MPIVSTKKSNMTASLTLINCSLRVRPHGWSRDGQAGLFKYWPRYPGWYKNQQADMNTNIKFTALSSCVYTKAPTSGPVMVVLVSGLIDQPGSRSPLAPLRHSTAPHEASCQASVQPQPPLKVPTPCLLCTSLPIHPTKNLIFLYLNSCKASLQQLL